MLFRARMKYTDTVANVTLLSFPVPRHCSGALKATASGDPARSLRDTTGAGVPGQSLAPAPGHAEVGFAPAAGSAATPRESRRSEENFPAQTVYGVNGWCNAVKVRSQSWMRFWASSGPEHICLDTDQDAEATGIISAVASCPPNSFTLKEEKWQKLGFIIFHK